jgi:hypothetical protein
MEAVHMTLQFKVNASPGVYKVTTAPERQQLLQEAVTEAVRRGTSIGEGITFHAKHNLQLTVNWVKKYVLLVTKDEADDWLPALC